MDNNDNKPIFLTRDRYEGAITTEADDAVLQSARTGEGLVHITSLEDLQELQRQATAVYKTFYKQIGKSMTRERAEYVHDLRVNRRCTWRAVAAACWAVWKDSRWHPATNQIAGMALCRLASEKLDISFD